MISIMPRGKRRFESLSLQEILALAIASEEEDGRRYLDVALRLKSDYPATAEMLEGMAREEDEHKKALLTVYKKRFGDHIPLLTRDDVVGFVHVEPVVNLPELRPEDVRRWANQVEGQNRRFYELAAGKAEEAEVKKLLEDLAAAEGEHEHSALAFERESMAGGAAHAEETEAHRQFVLQVVQPGLAGLMDGSVSTLAPLFAAAMATQDPHATLLVGLAASVGAGISMGLTEGMADDGKISGRGSPWLRGVVCGVMTMVGGVGHALPYLLPHFGTATMLALAVVVVELIAIAWIRWKWMESGFWSSVVQIIIGGLLVVAAGFLLGGG
ncbi:MAG: hypothetical protein COY40_05965 [Alphaproteobacteria bacterium CG_4_10_14_0_8_um_filter_53_9]|nr:MAG: hypothetical protein COY40_05965 [Alphaproteobacteria bacterium CG_4_10_14_0_8_um_filter_53_9]